MEDSQLARNMISREWTSTTAAQPYELFTRVQPGFIQIPIVSVVLRGWKPHRLLIFGHDKAGRDKAKGLALAKIEERVRTLGHWVWMCSLSVSWHTKNYQPTIHKACAMTPMAAHVVGAKRVILDDPKYIYIYIWYNIVSLIPTLFVWRLKIHSGPLLAIVRTQEEGISDPETTMHCFSESVWINAKYYQLPATSCFMQSVKDLLKFWFTGRKTNHAIQSVALSPVFGTILEVFLFTFDSGNLMAIYNTCFFWQNGTGTMTMTMLGRRRALEDVWEDQPAVLLCKGPMCGRITRDLKVCSVILSSEELMLFRLRKIVLWLTRVAGLPSLPPGDRYYGQEAAEVSTGLSTERALCHASALHVRIMRYL